MEPVEMFCVDCERTWTARKTDDELSLNWRQCPYPDCRSYVTLKKKSFDNIVEHVKKGNPVQLEWVDAWLNMVLEEGLLGRTAYDRRRVIDKILKKAKETPIKRIDIKP